MEKTIRYFLLIMIVTGALFAYGCFGDELFDSDVEDGTVMSEKKPVAPTPVSTPEPTPRAMPMNTENSAMMDGSTPMMEMMLAYKNGTYSAEAGYLSPAGNESISVSLTLDNDIVTAVNLVPHASNETSIKFQSAVKNAAPALIIGKKLTDIGAFSKISTSSLTLMAFNQAISSIKASAKN
ncbi:MAG: hypothetical protein Q8P68_04670 [Candidatus Peregrinibacteria bacterium]|nr:hypothetical protein [Candidatus Peregrinibacteria bacterium]MDZ4244675.1 hypothetical protein [Candidatus Gracilibacteria bacterium]